MDFIYDKLDYCITVLNALEVMDKSYKLRCTLFFALVGPVQQITLVYRMQVPILTTGIQVLIIWGGLW